MSQDATSPHRAEIRAVEPGVKNWISVCRYVGPYTFFRHRLPPRPHPVHSLKVGQDFSASLNRKVETGARASSSVSRVGKSNDDAHRGLLRAYRDRALDCIYVENSDET